MSSAIDDTIPVAGFATSAPIRANFATIKSEVDALQDSVGGWGDILSR